MEKHGIDVSHWQGVINWYEVAKHIDFAMLKAGGSDKGFYTDSMFEKNYNECKRNNIPVGCYYFVGSRFTSKVDGTADALRFLKIIEGKKFEYPIVLDLETTPAIYRNGATDGAVAFCETLEKHGYYVSIYASDISGFKEKLDINRLKPFDKWVARYGSSPKYVKSYGMWQYSSVGTVNGIAGNVDLDMAYIDYPKVMRDSHLNGF